ncbi:MAG: hypothetical protein DSZ08_04825 [Sulfurovum sp.]|nr:MAG: hypothetical protein DSZ08_04825 [Sulfurovum sp.]
MKKILLFLAVSLWCFSMPAYHGKLTFTQQDGSTFEGKLKGDEYFSWIEDRQGNIILFNNQSKTYEYAKLTKRHGISNLVPSGIKVFKNMGNKAPYKNNTISKKTLMRLWKSKREHTRYHH